MTGKSRTFKKSRTKVAPEKPCVCNGLTLVGAKVRKCDPQISSYVGKNIFGVKKFLAHGKNGEKVALSHL